MSIGSISQAQDYLTEFGYLESSRIEDFGFGRYKAFAPAPTQLGIVDTNTVQAIKAFQKFSGLEQTGILDEATLRQMEKPRCGFPDVGQFVLQGNKWDKTKLTFGFTEITGDLPELHVRQALGTAFDLWSKHSKLTFDELPSSAVLPDIQIRFVKGNHNDGFAFDGPGNVLAHAFFPPPNGANLAGDCHFDDDELWSIANASGSIDLVTVAAHEIGHALGLAHSSDRNALMYAFYTGTNRKLGSDDIAGIQELYGARVHEPAPPKPPVQPPNNPPVAPPPSPPNNPVPTGSGVAIIHEPNTNRRDYLWTGRHLQWINSLEIRRDFEQILKTEPFDVSPETFEWMIQQHLAAGGKWPGRQI